MKFATLLLFLTTYSFANENVTCSTQIRIFELGKLEMQNCKMAGALVDNESVKEHQKNKIYEKLSKKLSNKLEQNLEELSLLDRFFSVNKQDLTMGNADLKDNCRLSDKIKAIEKKCGGKKLDLLKKAFNSPGSSLVEKVSTKYSSLKNTVQSKNNKTCPLDEKSGNFILNSQLNVEDSFAVISKIKSGKDAENYFNKYPQLKWIEKGNSELKSKFTEYIKSFNDKPEKAKDFLTAFFFSNENKNVLAQSLANQCKELNSNIETFLCGDLDQIGSLDDEVSTSLFNLPANADLNKILDVPDVTTADGELFLTAYGFQCLALANPKKQTENKNTVDKWYKDISSNTRPVKKSSDSGDSARNFCSFYNCKEEAVKEAPSCSKNGYLAFNDFEKMYNCDVVKCRDDIAQYFSYMKTLKIEEDYIAQSSSKYNQSGDSSSTSEIKQRSTISAFSQNLLGVEGTLKAEGREITASTIAEKTREFEIKKLDTPSSAPSQSKVADNRQQQQTSLQAEQIQPQSQEQSTEQPKQQFSNQQFQQHLEQFDYKDTSTALSNQPKKKSFKQETYTYTAPDDRDGELKKLREELENITSNIKGTNAEKFSTVIDSNTKQSAAAATTIKADPTRGLNDAERARLEQYEKNLRSWESKLINWENNIATTGSRDPARAQNQDNAQSKTAMNDTFGRGQQQAQSAMLTSTSASDKDKGRSDKAAVTNANGTSAEAPEAVLSSDELPNLKVETLRKMGLSTKSLFIMKVRHENRIYDVPVKTFAYKGKDVLVPILTDKTSLLSQIVLNSPLFADYKALQLDRQKEREAFAQAIQ